MASLTECPPYGDESETAPGGFCDSADSAVSGSTWGEYFSQLALCGGRSRCAYGPSDFTVESEECRLFKETLENLTQKLNGALTSLTGTISLSPMEIDILKQILKTSDSASESALHESYFQTMREKLMEGSDGREVDSMIRAYSVSPRAAAPKRLSNMRGAVNRLIHTRRIVGDSTASQRGDQLSARSVMKREPSSAEAKFGHLLESSDLWGGFDIWTLCDAVTGDKSLAANLVAEHLLVTRRNLPSKLGLSEAKLRAFVAALVSQYADVSYHNCLHGADVMQSMHAILCASPQFDARLQRTARTGAIEDSKA